VLNAAPPFPISHHQGPASILQRLCAQSAPGDHSVTRLRYGLVRPRLSPSRVLDRAQAERRAAYALFGPDGQGFIACGVLDEGRGVDLGALAPRRPRRVDAGLARGPEVVFGGAFSTTAPDAQGPWARWPVALWRAPETVFSFCSHDRKQVVTGSVDLTATGDPRVAAQRLYDRLNWPQRPSPWSGVAQRPSAIAEEPRARWCQRVQRIRAACGDARLHKVVAARALRHEAPPGASFWVGATFDALRRAHPEATVFAVVHEGQAMVGATPERLASLRGRALSTHALAGTAPRGVDAHQDRALGEALLGSAKDRHEHQIVVDAIAAALSEVGQDVRCGPISVRRLSGLQHLETPLTAQMGPEGFLGAVGHLHPTPAVGGAPRAAALAWLRQTEPLDRGWYGGPIGWLEDDRAECVVAIRSALLHRRQAWTFAGAGIVAESDPVAEWAETTLKLQTAGDALRLGRLR